MRLRGIERVQHRALLIGGEQGGFYGVVLVLLLGQELVVLLEYRALYRALDLAGQALLQVEALGVGLGRGCAVGQAIQWVVVVTAEHGFIWAGHGLCSVGKTDSTIMFRQKAGCLASRSVRFGLPRPATPRL
jgi:hypothetical protein